MKHKPLVLRDEIHGDISFERPVRSVVDHPSFQRLRYIKQLGLAEYVFPTANHTRFQHSLGASFLAGCYLESILEVWDDFPLTEDVQAGDSKFFVRKTASLCQEVASHPESFEYWRRVAMLAGMLHDVGHGPWSHTYEFLRLPQDFSEIIAKLDGPVAQYFHSRSGHQLMHEDISVLYIFQILGDLEDSGEFPDAAGYFAPVSSLVNRKLWSAAFAERLEQGLRDRGIRGGADFHKLLRPILSGPFDVDRMDYIQRDGRNCGVSLGGIEWRRIIRYVVPCLAEHANVRNEPSDVVLLSKAKNLHVLDDFIFSLFQMYAQVYMHPKIVGIEEAINSVLQARAMAKSSDFAITYEVHRQLSDEGFLNLLEKQLGVSELRPILLRHPQFRHDVVGFPSRSGLARDLSRKGYRQVSVQDRPMLKDGVGVFLFSRIPDLPPLARDWVEVSPIAGHFHAISHAPEIWIRPHGD